MQGDDVEREIARGLEREVEVEDERLALGAVRAKRRGIRRQELAYARDAGLEVGDLAGGRGDARGAPSMGPRSSRSMSVRVTSPTPVATSRAWSTGSSPSVSNSSRVVKRGFVRAGHSVRELARGRQDLRGLEGLGATRV
jgi:hypothetical protein